MVSKAVMERMTPEVDAWFEQSDHQQVDALRLIREYALGADKRVAESIKWKVPTFSFNGNIFSFHAQAKKQVSLMFHKGAELTADHSLLEGDGKQARMVRLADIDAVKASKRDFQAIVKAWCLANS